MQSLLDAEHITKEAALSKTLPTGYIQRNKHNVIWCQISMVGNFPSCLWDLKAQFPLVTLKLIRFVLLNPHDVFANLIL